jgi:hypothetical protein
VHLEGRGLVLGLVGQVGQDAGILQRLDVGVVGVDGRLRPGLLFQLGLRLLVVVPEVRLARLGVQLGYLPAFAGDVKDAPGEPRGGSPA